MNRSMSLHIGLNAIDPAHYDGWDGALEGCEFDARDMEQLASSRKFGRRNLLLTSEATADNILAAIGRAARELQPGAFSSSASQVTAGRSPT